MNAYAIASLDAPLDDRARRRIDEVIAAGADFLQLRAPGLTARDAAEAAAFCAQATRGSGTRLLVNRRADIAAAVGAGGVHLPAAGIPVRAARQIGSFSIVGRSCHSLQDCERAAAEGADYVLLGPVFAPRSKQGEGMIAIADLARAGAGGLAVFALGGISIHNMERLRGLPIAGIAAVTLFMEDRPLEPIMEAVRAL